MHYYKFNIGDYKAHTDHLELIEDLAYRRMIDWYYLHESPLSLNINEISKKILMRTHTESIAYVLSEFFEKTDLGYFHKRISEDVKAFKDKSDKARSSAKARWNKIELQSEDDANALHSDIEGNTNHKTLNTNHKTLNTKQSNRKVKTLLSSDFLIDQSMLEWFSGKNFKVDMVSSTDKWKDAMLARGDKYIDWVAAWRNGMKKANEWYLDKNPQITQQVNSPRAFSQ